MNFHPKKEEGSYKCRLVITFSQEVGYLRFLYIFTFAPHKVSISKKRKKEMSTVIIDLYDY